MTEYARLIVLFFAAMLAQWWWTSHGAIAGLAPQLLLVLTVAVAARYGATRAMFLGFFWGLFLDVLAARLVGANALAFTLAAYGTGSVRRQVDLLGAGPQMVMVYVVSVIYFLLMGLFGLVFLKTFLWVGWPQFLLDPVYNCLVVLGVLLLWEPFMGSYRG